MEIVIMGGSILEHTSCKEILYYCRLQAAAAMLTMFGTTTTFGAW
jgi:hypothetical protein